MPAIVLDPCGMQAAIVAVDRYLDTLEGAVRALVSVPLPTGLPPAVRSRVEGAVASARYEVLSAVRALDGMPADLRRRVVAARRADLDWPLAVGLGTGAVKMFAGSFSAAVPSAPALAAALLMDARHQPRPSSKDLWRTYRDQKVAAKEFLERTVPSRLRTGAEWAGRAAGFANAFAVGFDNFRNPSLSTSQKIGRTGATVATDAAVSVGAAAASGAVFGSAAGPAGVLVGGGAAVAWTIADNKFGVSNHLGDAAAAGLNAAGDGVEAAASRLSDGFRKLGL